MAKKLVGAFFITGEKPRIKKGRIAGAIVGIIEWPTKIHACQNGKVIWGILNLCEQDVEVSVDNFIYFSEAGFVATEPLNFGLQGKTRTVKSGKVRAISATVRSDANLGRYYYQILINGELAVDPELEIERV